MTNKVLAKVNGKEITSAHVDMLIRQMPQQQAQQLMTEDGRKRVLEELIQQNLILADAVENKLNETEDFKKEIERLSDSVMVQVNIKKTMADVKVSDEEAEKFFTQYQAHYAQPEQADTSHILVATEEESNDIYEKIMKDEVTFEEAAKTFSNCPSKDKGGLLGMFPKGKMVPEYEAAAFTMATGEISKPVKTQFGFHIIRLNNKTEAKKVNFEDIKAQVINDALTYAQRNAYNAKIENLKNKYTIEMVEA